MLKLTLNTIEKCCWWTDRRYTVYMIN